MTCNNTECISKLHVELVYCCCRNFDVIYNFMLIIVFLRETWHIFLQGHNFKIISLNIFKCKQIIFHSLFSIVHTEDMSKLQLQASVSLWLSFAPPLLSICSPPLIFLPGPNFEFAYCIQLGTFFVLILEFCLVTDVCRA